MRIPEFVGRTLEEKRSSGNLRTIPQATATPLIDLVSNDYLGLAARSEAGQFDALRSELALRHGMTSSASRLLSRRQEEHEALEELLEGLYGRPALLFNSGYHANVGLISALASPGTLFLVDRLAHASVYDGLMAGRARFERFRHNDLTHLQALLERHHDSAECLVVVVESVYSMDGDTAPLGALADLRRRFPKMLLYVDEAHAVGVRGLRGLGLGEETGTLRDIDILVGTFGKALASAGAFTVCAPEMKDYLVNCSRSLIFSTALPPLDVAWSREMLLRSVGMRAEREHLRELSQWMEGEIAAILGHPTGSQSHIIPIVTGSAQTAIDLAESLRAAGFDALPIRRPTVPPGGERLRLSLSAPLTRPLLRPLLQGIRPVGARPAAPTKPHI